ncbi:MAG: hypothetical protein WBD99_03770 [Thermodesulfobacteriota bacterium]
MIEISLIKDNTNYQKENLDKMEKLFKRNFITRDANELEKQFKSETPEIRIHLRLAHGVLPVVLFTAVGDDMLRTVSNEIFLNAFLNPCSEETPALIFHFQGQVKSFQFKINSRDEEQIKLGSKTVFDTLLNFLNAEKLPSINKESLFFEYLDGDWKKAEKY